VYKAGRRAGQQYQQNQGEQREGALDVMPFAHEGIKVLYVI